MSKRLSTSTMENTMMENIKKKTTTERDQTHGLTIEDN
jgi:hypothetical protein